MFEIFGQILSIILIVVGFVLVILAGWAKWIGGAIVVVGILTVFGNPIFGIITAGIGALLFIFSGVAKWIIRLVGIGLIIWGIASFIGVIPLQLIPIPI